MRRALALLMMAVALAPGTWLREAIPPPVHEARLSFVPLQLPPTADRERLLGAFTLEAVWRLDSPHAYFGGYSALLPLPHGRFLAISDTGRKLRFAPPGARRAQPEFGWVAPGKKPKLPSSDAEAASRDPTTGTIWIAWESSNAITRHDPALRKWVLIRPSALRDWGVNSGPESMVRLADGSFILLREGGTGWFDDRRHAALRYRVDPLAGTKPERFVFEAPAGFSPTDMAQLPDGRVLILLRKLSWPIPARFSVRIAIADPSEIEAGGVWRPQIVARLEKPLPVDNFESIAVTPRRDGTVNVWLISDNNNAVFQRTLLWKLAVDPAELPAPARRARSSSAGKTD